MIGIGIGIGVGLGHNAGEADAPAAKTVYVAKTGNDSTGTGLVGAPYLTIAKGLTEAGGGGVVIIGNGTYAESLTITANGTAGAPTTLRAANNRLAILSGGGWGVDIRANHVEIDGLKFSKTGGGGGVQCYWEKHHITVRNCEMDGGSDHGIAAIGGEFYTFEGNYVHGQRYSDYWSAISIYQGRNVTGDTTTTGFRNIIRNNICDDNYQTGGWHTDGNGIIVDDLYHTQGGSFNFDAWSGVTYPYPTLVEQNLCTRHGGRGVHVFVSAHVTVRNNTAAFNNRDTEIDGTWRGEIHCQTADYCTFVNNIGVARSNASGAVGSGDTSRLTSNAGLGWFSGSADMASTAWRNNLGWDIDASRNTASTENTPHALDGATGHVFADPLFVSEAPDGVGDYRLTLHSPAGNAGSATYGLPATDLDGETRVQDGVVNIGAYESPWEADTGEVTIFDHDTDVPDGDSYDAEYYTLGTVVQASVDGQITSVWWYKPSTASPNQTTFAAAVYSDGGTELATGSMSGAVVGWNEIPLSAPLDIDATARYVAAVAVQRYGATANAFLNSITNGPITALSDATAPGNGRFNAQGSDPTPHYPTGSYNRTWYGVDVSFVPD